MQFNNGGEWLLNDRVTTQANINWYGTNVEPTMCMNNDNIFNIDYTNAGIADGSVIAANNKQLEVQNYKVEKMVLSKRVNTNNADDNAAVVVAIAKCIKLCNDREEETVLCYILL